MKALKFIYWPIAFIALYAVYAFPVSTSVTLAWDASPDPTVTGYRLYYGGASGNYTNIVDCGNVTSVSVNPLLSGGTYYFAVTAYDSSGLESVPSNEVSYNVPIGPLAPSNLTPSLHRR